MLIRGCIAGFLWGVVAVALCAGCATQRATASPASTASPVSTDASRTPDTEALAGVWEGEVWETTPSYFVQGVRRVTLNIDRDGSWTALSGGTPCASGKASRRGGLVVLGGTRIGPDHCMPYSLASKDGRMRAVFDTSFKAREASAMIDLTRVRGPLPQAAQGPARP